MKKKVFFVAFVFILNEISDFFGWLLEYAGHCSDVSTIYIIAWINCSRFNKKCFIFYFVDSFCRKKTIVRDFFIKRKKPSS